MQNVSGDGLWSEGREESVNHLWQLFMYFLTTQ